MNTQEKLEVMLDGIFSNLVQRITIMTGEEYQTFKRSAAILILDSVGRWKAKEIIEAARRNNEE